MRFKVTEKQLCTLMKIFNRYPEDVSSLECETDDGYMMFWSVEQDGPVIISPEGKILDIGEYAGC